MQGTLKTNADFRSGFKGKRAQDDYFIVIYRKAPLRGGYGLVVSKKVTQNAVARNRITRQVRAVFNSDLSSIMEVGASIIIQPKVAAVGAETTVLQESLIALVTQAKSRASR